METGTAYVLVAEKPPHWHNRHRKRHNRNETFLCRLGRPESQERPLKPVINSKSPFTTTPTESSRVPSNARVTTSDIRNAFLSLQLRVGDVQPQDTLLAQNFPNPFNPETWIPYQLNKSTEVKISIYDISGRLVRSLDLGWQPTGSYMTPSSAAYWDGRNAVGERVASGIYFYTLQTSDFAATRRMVILK